MTTADPLLQDDPQTVAARKRVGMVLQDKWTLDALLGVGGMAAVYAATHRNGKRVAVKMLHEELSHEEEIKQRFLQEGYAANAIQHEGAVSVLDDDVASDGSAFIVMELLEGETIEQRWLRGGRKLPPGDVLAIAAQVLDVLAAAHAKNVVHRDIKPENLFLTKAGAVKVLDFGIARVQEVRQQRQSRTRAGTLMGTPAYMAPEQARAHWDEVDGRTDLWAVGATMFTLLTGQNVHEGKTDNDQLVLAATAPARSIRTLAPTLLPAVTQIVDRALEFERDRRWPDAASMQAAAQSALDALGGPESLAASSRRTLASARSGDAAGTLVSGGAGTLLEATRTPSALADWIREREVRAANAEKLRTSISDLGQKYAGAKKRTADVQSRLDVGRTERASLEQQFEKQVGTRTEAVEAARKRVRAQAAVIARKAIADRTTFGADLDPAREQIAKLQRAAEAAKRDVAVYDSAMQVYDGKSLKMGILLLCVAAALLLSLLVAPIVWRATLVEEPSAPVAPAATH